MIEDKAKEVYNNYRAGFFDRIFKRDEKKRAKLKEAILEAKRTDERTYQESLKNWNKELEEWQKKTGFAKRVISGDHAAMLAVVEKHKPSLSNIKYIGDRIAFNIKDENTVEVAYTVPLRVIVPKETYNVLKSGKLSVKQMPKGRYYEIYKNYVCSCVLRISNDLFSLLPINHVAIITTDFVCDASTGCSTDRPIISAVLSREELKNINWDSSEPFACLERLQNRMNFHKTKGFQSIEENTS